MKRHFVWFAAATLVAGFACRPVETGTPLGTTYAQIARPAIWRVLPRSQAETLGLQPGDVVLSYDDEPVKTTEELVQFQFRAVASPDRVPMTVMRGDAEIKLMVDPGVLGVLPDAERYTGSLAVAVEDVLGYYGVTVDYDWLAALTGETFAFTARPGGCRGAWPGGLAGDYLDGLTEYYGLTFRPVFAGDDADSARPVSVVQQEALAAVRDRLSRGRLVLVLGVWPGYYGENWGVATRYDMDDSLVYGYTLGSAGELALSGAIVEAYEVGYRATGEPEPADMLITALTQAMELGQAYADSGWQSGIAAYDVWIRGLDSVPFCPACPDSGQACSDRLVWALLANKESANRFLQDMREAIPEQVGIMDEIIADNSAIIGKLNGIIQSGIKTGTVERQQKLARAVNEIQLIETDLLGLYDDLIGEL
jgi:hypothetical protein